jgi:O-antigen/teichoic acid export membrane protein
MISIARPDVVWSFFASFFRIASTALLLPIILNKLPSEDVGLWTIFMSVTLIVTLFDFGFSSSFSRSISYIFSGVNELKEQGYQNQKNGTHVNYGLLKGTIESMRWFYFRLSIAVFAFLATIGTFYISIILKGYTGDKTIAYLAWALLCIINAYNLFTLYYEALLVGKGLVKKAKQIIVFSQVIFLIVAYILLLSGFGLVAIVASQAIYVILARLLTHRAFFSNEMKSSLDEITSNNRESVFKAVYPNALKLGLTVLGGILIQRSAVYIGSLFLSLEEIASYGLTRQVLDIIAGLSPIYITTYLPLISRWRIEGNTIKIKEIVIIGAKISFVVFTLGSFFIFFFGNSLLHLIKSHTILLPGYIMLAGIVVTFIEMNHATAGGILLTKNEVPFFIPSIVSGIATGLLMLFFLGKTNFGLLSLFLAPGIVDICYQSWKWPLEVVKDLNIRIKDFFVVKVNRGNN